MWRRWRKLRGSAPDADASRVADVLPQLDREVLLDDRGVLMSPPQALAGRSTGRVLSSDLPDLAARWLAVGLDGDALRVLAGHPPSDAQAIDDLWGRVVEELDVPSPPDEWSALLRHLPVQLARWRCGEVSSDDLTAELTRTWDAVSWDTVPGLSELLVLDEHRSATLTHERGALDREREALLTNMANEVSFVDHRSA